MKINIRYLSTSIRTQSEIDRALVSLASSYVLHPDPETGSFRGTGSGKGRLAHRLLSAA